MSWKMGKVGSGGKGWLPWREGPIFGQVLLSLLTPINFLLMQHVLVLGGRRWLRGRGRTGESLKPHNFSQLGNRGSPAGFSLRFSLITAACYSCCPYIFFLKYTFQKMPKKTQNSYNLSDLTSIIISSQWLKNSCFRYLNYVFLADEGAKSDLLSGSMAKYRNSLANLAWS